ncbi:MAG: amidohydrolase [Planctomycetes bacterium]|nr:amidohydrolase [Planctomycetota bacterium]
MPSLALWIVALAALPTSDPKDAVAAAVVEAQPRYAELARRLWKTPELGFLETQSSGLLADELERAGFRVERGVAGMPTAFVASFGSGEPVIGLLAEFDALPGMAQAAVPRRQPIEGQRAGQACGHHLFGPGVVAAATATADWLRTSHTSGTLRVYGTPAEEGGGGKCYMVRAGLFADVDAVLTWHPRDRNDPSEPHSLAVIAADFTFRGLAAHAAAAPERGRSALDGVEAFDHMVNLMREHVPQETRIHYVIKNGGDAPNIVPATAVVSYYVRHPDMAVLDGIFERVCKAAEGAALGTGTTVEREIVSAYYPILGNAALTRAQTANMRRVGGVRYDATERAFAEELRKSLTEAVLPLGSEATIAEPDPDAGVGSTDVGDVSWAAPTTQFFAATWVPGTPAHSWQAVAAGGTTIGEKGMLVASQTLALTLVDLFTDPKLVAEARAEFDARRKGRVWTSRIGDRSPPLDYRK